jgi:large-conductance mechanosensitive channel
MKLGKWIALAVAAIVLAEGIWGILVSLTRSLLVPLLAGFLGTDSHSLFYLGRGEINIADLFASVIQLCLAGIVFLLIRAWATSEERAKTPRPKKVLRRVEVPAVPMPVVTAPAAAAAQTTAAASSSIITATTQSTPETQVSAAPISSAKPIQKPVKPPKPQEVYYNLVGEPINPTEDE